MSIDLESLLFFFLFLWDWISKFTSAIISQPLILLFVVFVLIGLGIGLLKRILN